MGRPRVDAWGGWQRTPDEIGLLIPLFGSGQFTPQTECSEIHQCGDHVSDEPRATCMKCNHSGLDGTVRLARDRQFELPTTLTAAEQKEEREKEARKKKPAAKFKPKLKGKKCKAA